VSRWSRLGLRPRLLAIGVAGVAGALLIGGLLLYAAMATTLDRAAADGARAAARDVAALVDAGRLPEVVPVSGAQVVQVLDDELRVVAGSSSADRLTALVDPAEARRVEAGETVTVPGSRAGRSGDLVVAGAAAGETAGEDTGTGRVLVVAAVPTADLETGQRVLRTLLLVFFPAFLLVLAAIAWRVVGQALRPVEELRLGAERIGTSAAATGPRQLPVPPTGDEIAALATTLNGMLARLEAMREQQRAFVADAAHELRSPLASMRTQLEVAERLGEGGALPEGLLPEVQRLTALVEDLLVLARAGEPAAAPARASEDLDVEGLLADVAARYAAARVPVRVTGAGRAGGTAAVRAVPDELGRALGNLVDNAVRHASGEVRLAAQVRGDRVDLTVTDDGHGIPEAERERVFDRFARLEEARDRDSGGSGLGLAIARELLARAGGTVRLEAADPGVRAVVTLPLARGRAGSA
jgi:signal transduction histidine kinase